MKDSYSLQSFESEIFQKPVWRLEEVDAAVSVIEKARQENVALVSYREKSEDTDLDMLREAGFYPVETLVTLQCEIYSSEDLPSSIRLATVQDAQAVSELARNCFTEDRYHADPHISDEIADDIKARWMFNSVSGRADAVFLCELDGEILGFNACMVQEDRAVIDLIGVAAKARGQGVGRKLVDAMAQHYQGRVKFLRLGTQDTNTVSQDFYRKLGFQEVRRQTTWHWTP